MPAQAGLAVAAVLLGAIFLITSGGPDVAPAPRQQQAAAQQQLSEETRQELEQELAKFQEQAGKDGSDLEALESAAVLSARLGKFGEAEAQLVRLAEAKPGDAEVLRVLAEAQAAQEKWGSAAGSYRKALEAGGHSSLEVLQGLAGGYSRHTGPWLLVSIALTVLDEGVAPLAARRCAWHLKEGTESAWALDLAACSRAGCGRQGGQRH